MKARNSFRSEIKSETEIGKSVVSRKGKLKSPLLRGGNRIHIIITDIVMIMFGIDWVADKKARRDAVGITFLVMVALIFWVFVWCLYIYTHSPQ